MLSKAMLTSLKTTLFDTPSYVNKHNWKKIHQYRVSKWLQYLINKLCLQKCGTDKQIIVADKYDTSKTGFSNYPWATMTMIDDIL